VFALRFSDPDGLASFLRHVAVLEAKPPSSQATSGAKQQTVMESLLPQQRLCIMPPNACY
jgi:hypothetical protein